MPRHLEPVAPIDQGDSWLPPDGLDPGDWGDDDEPTPPAWPPWWRWVAVVVAIAMIVATPFAYALDRLLN